jgi:hypothetical protein
MSRANPADLALPERQPPGHPSIAGSKFGRLLAEAEVIPNKYGNRRWRCQCDCGKRVVVTQSALQKGKTSSCGCLHSERARAAVLIHGESTRGKVTPEYRTWRGMIGRCETPSFSHFPAYGGAGIKVCAGWHDYQAFVRDMGPKPSPKHSIDRVDNAKGYDCGKCADCSARGATLNCRWATHLEQVNNRRVTAMVEHKGQRVPLAQLARQLDVDYWAFRKRLKDGLSVEAAAQGAAQRERRTRR